MTFSYLSQSEHYRFFPRDFWPKMTNQDKYKQKHENRWYSPIGAATIIYVLSSTGSLKMSRLEYYPSPISYSKLLLSGIDRFNVEKMILRAINS